MKLFIKDNNENWVSTGDPTSFKNKSTCKVVVNNQGEHSYEFKRTGSGGVAVEALNELFAHSGVLDGLVVDIGKFYRKNATNEFKNFNLIGGYSLKESGFKKLGNVREEGAVPAGKSIFFLLWRDHLPKLEININDAPEPLKSAFIVQGINDTIFFDLSDSTERYFCTFEEFNNLINSEPLSEESNTSKEPCNMEIRTNSVNTILYGPPGTGKTYSLKEVVANILENAPENYANFNSLLEAYPRQIEFLTFHQSYSYEDFIEGITARTTESGGIEYLIKNGVFKTFCRRAYAYKVLTEHGLPAARIDDFSDAIEIYARSTDSQLIQLVQQDKTEALKTLLDWLERKPDSTHTERLDPRKFVICIDEINRGSISKIFGELITLIEDTKRYGGDDYLPATLAGSGDQLRVPDNLYIIGTMNTADRSIAKLDVALRRRFDFIPMYPQPHLINDVRSRDFLQKLNSAIFEKNRSHELAVGHAFFMNVDSDEEFNRVLKNKVIPLLEEYFMEDRNKVCDALNATLNGEIFFDASTFRYKRDGNDL